VEGREGELARKGVARASVLFVCSLKQEDRPFIMGRSIRSTKTKANHRVLAEKVKVCQTSYLFYLLCINLQACTQLNRINIILTQINTHTKEDKNLKLANNT
jgi:hypothetical protein